MANTVLVTATGRWIIVSRLGANAASFSEPKQLGWGTGGVAGGPFTAAATDVAAFSESSEARVASTSSVQTTTTTDDTYQCVGTITSSSTQTITEVLLSPEASKPASNTVAAAGVVGSAVSTTLNTGTSFSPGNNGYVQIRTEVMQVTAGSGTSSLTVVRGANGSSAISSIAASDVVTAGNAPGSAVVTNGDLLLHASFSGVALNSGDSLASTISIKFS